MTPPKTKQPKKCPICGQELEGTGGHNHIASLEKHPDFHPEVTSHEERKALVEEMFPNALPAWRRRARKKGRAPYSSPRPAIIAPSSEDSAKRRSDAVAQLRDTFGNTDLRSIIDDLSRLLAEDARRKN